MSQTIRSHAADIPWTEGLTIGEVLRRSAARFSRQEALVFVPGDVRLTYGELDEQVDAAARGILALGIRRGQHVAVWATNVPEWVVLQLAAARVGVVLVTINPAYRPFEFRYVLRHCDATALFLLDRYKSSNYFGMLARVCPQLAQAAPGAVGSDEFPRLRWVVAMRGDPPPGAISWNDMLRRGEKLDRDRLETAAAGLQPHQPINIQYTSATSGRPKGIVLSHRNVLTNAFHVGGCQRLGPRDRICIAVPFYHCFGCVMGTTCAVIHGAAMIIPGESFKAQSTLAAIAGEKATAIYGVPTMFIAQLEDDSFDQHDLSSLRTGIMAGSPCPVETMYRVMARMGAEDITIAYGQTEASPVITQTRVDDPLQLRVGTVGRPLPGVEVKLVDPATGDSLGDDTEGELCVRGHGVMLGYYNDPEATAASIDSDGWLHTEDLALRRSDGYYRITGRIKDMVIRGGENLYPREIEQFLATHEAVDEVSAVGVPDPRYGEELCVWIKLHAGHRVSADQLRNFSRKNVARFKIPRHVKFVDSFPQRTDGVVDKPAIRRQMIDELELSEPETA